MVTGTSVFHVNFQNVVLYEVKVNSFPFTVTAITLTLTKYPQGFHEGKISLYTIT
jgi:hypothetical protein